MVLMGDWDGDGSQTLALRRGTTVLTQRLLNSAALRKIEVPGITRSAKVEVHHEDGAPDTIVVAP